MSLRESTTWLLHAKDVGRWLTLADQYMQMRNKVPDTFVLPADHTVLRSVIEAFASDTAAFSEYLKALRDGLTGAQYDETHALYRTVSVRALQVVRRTRIRKAVLLLAPAIEASICRATTYTEQTVIAHTIETDWGAARMRRMERARSQYRNGSLSSEDRAAILDGYWDSIDKELAEGLVPLQDDTMDSIIKALTT